MAEAAAYLERMRDAVIFAGGKMGPFEQRPNWICRAATRLGIDPSRAAGYFYRKLTVVPAWEHDAVQARLNALQQRLAEGEALNAQTRQTIAEARASLAGGMPGAQQRPARPMGERTGAPGSED